MSHGNGGKKTSRLIDEIILPNFNNKELSILGDGAVLNTTGEIAFSTDSFVIDPYFFPGGDIGKLSICGTVNDLLMCGSIPKYISLSLILEEGFKFEELEEIIKSAGETASVAGVKVVTGDTKVVDKGHGHGIYINTAGIGEVINFDGTQSNDPDGQIVNYSWEFGDGQTASGSTASHSYSAAGVFTYKLIVTDNKNATDEATGQITISGSASRFTINPALGTINPGESMTISVDYNSSGLNEGNYQGQVSITSNGGNFTLPVAIIISQYSDVNGEEEIVTEYELNQNFPNPFNASTIINFAIPQSGNTELSVYDISGRLVRKLIYNDLKAGKYKITFEASGLSSGIYFYRLRSGMYIKTNKLVLIK
jgi:hypothetical protein